MELGPDGTLSAMGRECLDGDGDRAVFVPALRREGDETRAVMSALAHLHVRGVEVDFTALYGGTGYLEAARRALVDHFSRKGEAVELVPVPGDHWRDHPRRWRLPRDGRLSAV